MIAKIDVVYFNGEAVSCQAEHVPFRKNGAVLELTRNLLTDVVFRFCNIDGMPLTVIAPEDFGKAQVLLSCRDRVLAATEENIILAEDEAGFQTLTIKNLNVDSAEIRQVLADSYLEVEPARHGKVKCEFSVAIYSGSCEHAMQLFFTMETLVKDTPEV